MQKTQRLDRLCTSPLIIGIFLAMTGCGTGSTAGATDTQTRREAALARLTAAERRMAERLLKERPPAAPIPIFVDGERQVPDGQPLSHALIDPARVSTVRLLRGREAETRTGTRGIGDVIWIETIRGS